LEFPRLESASFSYAHPIVGGVFHIGTRMGTAIFYVIAGICVILMRRTERQEVVLRERSQTKDLQLERGALRSIGGLASGVAQLIGVDAAYARVFFILLNVLTFGVFGILYLIVVFFLRRTGRVSGNVEATNAGNVTTPNETNDHVPSTIRWAIALLFLSLATVRIMTEFRLFFFNEPFFQGILFAMMGLLLAWRGLRYGKSEQPIFLLVGASLLFVGVEDISSAMFRVQLPMMGRFEAAFLIAGLSIVYDTIVRLTDTARRVGIALALVCFVAAAIVQTDVLPSRYLIALVQFYDFFYPLIFVGFGLVLALD